MSELTSGLLAQAMSGQMPLAQGGVGQPMPAVRTRQIEERIRLLGLLTAYLDEGELQNLCYVLGYW